MAKYRLVIYGYEQGERPHSLSELVSCLNAAVEDVLSSNGQYLLAEDISEESLASGLTVAGNLTWENAEALIACCRASKIKSKIFNDDASTPSFSSALALEKSAKPEEAEKSEVSPIEGETVAVSKQVVSSIALEEHRQNPNDDVDPEEALSDQSSVTDSESVESPQSLPSISKNRNDPTDALVSEDTLKEDKPVVAEKYSALKVKSVAITSGYRWIGEGFRYFKIAPFQCMAVVVAVVIVSSVTSLFPFVGPFLTLLLLSFSLGAGVKVLRGLADQKSFDVSELMSVELSECLSLVVMSALYLLTLIVLWAFGFNIIFGAEQAAGFLGSPHATGESVELIKQGLGMGVLFIFFLTLPVTVIFSLVPFLIVLGKMPVLPALMKAAEAVVKNILPFTVLFLGLLFWSVIASMAFFIGWLILIPTAYAAIFAAYLRIFTENDN